MPSCIRLMPGPLDAVMARDAGGRRAVEHVDRRDFALGLQERAADFG